jgi:hypothetical protein
MNEQEQKVLDCLVDAWNNYVKLPILHPDDNDEFRHSLHNLQRIIGIRKLRRESNDWYNALRDDECDEECGVH